MKSVFRLALVCVQAALSLSLSHAAIAPSGPKSAAAGPAAPRGPVQVVDAVGRPVPGVTVLLQPRPESLIPENIIETTSTVTDAQGQFQPPPPEAGDTYIVLRKPGLETLAMESNRVIPEKITMRAGRTVTGQVLDTSGQPIPGAIVGPVIHPPTMRCMDHWEHRNPLARQIIRAADDGTFRLSALPMEAFSVQVTAPGRTPTLATILPGQVSVKIGLPTGGAIVTGKVIGSKDRAPQSSIPVEAIGNNLTLSSYTDNQGTYAFDNLPTGTWTLRPAGGGPRSGTQSRAVVFEIDKPDEVRDVPLVLNQGILLAGRAIDAQTSEPLAGINITLSGYAGRGAKAVFTNPDGTFAFENLDSLQDVLFRFDPVKFVYLLPGGATRDYFDLTQAGDTNFDLTTITLPLHRRLPVKGKVVDASGKPAIDAEVHFQSKDVLTSAPSKSGPSPMEFSAMSNAEGIFQVGLYPAGRYKVWAQQDVLVSQIQHIAAYTTSPVAPMEFRLDQAAEVSGIVVSANDQPVTNAIVIAWPADRPQPEEDPIPGRDTYFYSKSNNEGYFTLKGLRGEPMIMRATHRDYVQPATLPLDPAKAAFISSDSLRLKFPAGGQFTAIVTDDSGQPLSRAEVRADYHMELEGKTVTVPTDEFGRATIQSIPASQLTKVIISHPMFAPYESPEALSLGTGELRVQLKKRGSVIVKLDSLPATGAENIEIHLLSVPGSPKSTAPASGYNESSKAGIVAGQATFASLQPAWYKAAYANGGAFSETEPVYVDAGSGDHILNLTLPQGSHLTGIVKDKKSGEGIAGANITIRPAIESDFVAQEALQNTTSGDGGAFELFNVGSGRLHVKVVAASYPDFENEIAYTPGTPLEIELSNAPGALKGRVTQGGAPVEGALVVLSAANITAGPLASVVTDAQGNYSLKDFPVGTYTISVEAPIGEGENITRKTQNAEVHDESATLDFQFQALVTVTGVARLQGKPISRPGATPVSLLFRADSPSGDSKMVNLGEGGKYSVQLEPGNYIVSLEDREGTKVNIPSGSATTLDLDF